MAARQRKRVIDSEAIERRGAAVVAYVRGARAKRRDLGGQSVRDYDVVFPDGTVEPLEVTIHAERSVVQTGARLRQADRAAPTLRRYWVVDIPNSLPTASGERVPYDVRRFLREAEPALQMLEAAGYERFDLGMIGRDRRIDVTLRQLAQLGCQFGFSHALPTGQPGEIHAPLGVGGVISAELIPEAIEFEAAKSDNQSKLREPPQATLRHLLVVVDSSTTVISAAHRGMIGRVPVLPAPITTAWIVGAEVVYFVTPPDTWKSRAIPLEVFDHPERWIDC